MSHSQVRERLTLLEELHQIVAAMKNLAYVELHRLTRLQEAQAAASQALQQALSLTGLTPLNDAGNRDVWLVIGSENGFCGGFNEQLAQAVLRLYPQYPKALWLIAGNRLQQLVEYALPAAIALASAGTSEEVNQCLEQWTDILSRHIVANPTQHTPSLYVLHHSASQSDEFNLTQTALLLPTECRDTQTRTYLPSSQLQPALLADQLRMQLLGALLQSLQQENRARLAQMQRAQDHLDEAEQTLQRRYFHDRQADITAELQTLMASLTAGHPLGFH